MIPELPVSVDILPLQPDMLATVGKYSAVVSVALYIVTFIAYVVTDFNRRWVREAPFTRAVEGYIIHIVPMYNWWGFCTNLLRFVIQGTILGLLLFTLGLGVQELSTYYL